MINANELRRGNYFLYGKENLIDKMFTLTFDREDGLLINGQIPESHLRPIPLTPDILIASGFKKSNEFDTWYLIEEGMTLELQKDSGWWWQVDDVGDNEGSHWRPIKHVHQLQNLYFALTGKELEIKILTPTAP